jgi:Xaa-Pro aminopeptidase
VAVDAHAGNPHYEPTPNGSATLGENQLVLLDVWGKLNQPGAVYYDVTWMGYTGPKVPKSIEKVFNLVRDARDAAISFVENAIPAGQRLKGWEVDRVARSVIEAAGYGPQFVHRTGHSIGEQTHGNGPNMDNLETHDEREIIPNVCFSIEPGIYLPEFGVRLEVNMFVGESTAEVTGPVQRKIVTI